MLLVPSVSREEAQKLAELRQSGLTYAQVGKALNRCRQQVARYERILERYGIEAFAK